MCVRMKQRGLLSWQSFFRTISPFICIGEILVWFKYLVILFEFFTGKVAVKSQKFEKAAGQELGFSLPLCWRRRTTNNVWCRAPSSPPQIVSSESSRDSDGVDIHGLALRLRSVDSETPASGVPSGPQRLCLCILRPAVDLPGNITSLEFQTGEFIVVNFPGLETPTVCNILRQNQVPFHDLRVLVRCRTRVHRAFCFVVVGTIACLG